HEARHAAAAHLDNLADRTRWCEGSDSSCERSWTSGDSNRAGSTTYQVKFIIAASRLQNFFSPGVLAGGRTFANGYLNTRFKYHPGFNLTDPTGSRDRLGNLERVYWDWARRGDAFTNDLAAREDSGVEVAYFPDPDEAMTGITAIGLRALAFDAEP